jgi:hypothetical protein
MNILRDLGILILSLFECQHTKRGAPMNHRQGCLTCGAFRFYEYGEPPSPWYRYKNAGHTGNDRPAFGDKDRPITQDGDIEWTWMGKTEVGKDPRPEKGTS